MALKANNTSRRKQIKKKKKVKALKASTDSEADDASDDDSEDDEVSMLVKKLSKAWKRRPNYNNNFKKDRKGKTNIDDLTCYNCGQKGHFKPDCPKLKDNKRPTHFKKKAMAATWSDSEEEEQNNSASEDEENIANLCFMADYESENEVTLPTDLTFEELLNMYEDLVHNSKKLTLHYLAQKKAFSQLKAENEELITSNRKLEAENTLLKTEASKVKVEEPLKQTTETLYYDVGVQKPFISAMFPKTGPIAPGTTLLDKVLIAYTNRPHNSKAGIGSKNYEPNKRKPPPTCYYCHKIGHSKERCFKLQKAVPTKRLKFLKQMDFVRASPTNKKGPKQVWVPKVKQPSMAGTEGSSQKLRPEVVP